MRGLAAIVLVLAGCDHLLGLNAITQSDAMVRPIELVQQITASGQGMTLGATLPTPPVAGHLLVMIGGDEAIPLDDTTGGGVAPWKLATRSTAYSNVEVWYGVTDGTSSTVTISALASQAIWISLSEWSGVTSIDVFAAQAGTTGPATAGDITTAFTPDLVVFAASDYDATLPATPSGGSWSDVNTVGVGTHVVQSVWYRVATAIEHDSPAIAVTQDWDAALVAFRE